MDDQQLIIRFEGASAKHHVMGMRDLGESLKGIERILTTGIYAMRAGRYPNTNARLPFSVLVSSPRQGSVEFVALWESVGPILPLLPEVYLSGVPEAVRNWLIGVLLKMGGREDQSSKHLSEVLSIMEQVEGNRHLEIIALLDREHERTRRYAKQAVTAVGPSCDKLVIPSIIEVAEIDIAIAEVIRSGDDLEVSDMETMRVLVDGFIHHSKQIKLHHPTEPGRFLTEYIRDPAFDNFPNVYTEAASRQQWLEVATKVTKDKKDGRIKALYIMDAKILEDLPPLRSTSR